MRLFPAAAALILAIAPILLIAPRPPDTALRVTPVPLDAADPGRTRIGRLRYLGGWALASRDPAFGGFSSLVADGRGGLVSVTDSGMAARFVVGRGVRLVSLHAIPVPSSAGELKMAHDAESATRDDDGHIWVGFEGTDRIARYDATLTRLQASAAPPAMADWPSNGGAESLARLADGRFLVISEKGRVGPGVRPALLFPGDPTDPATAPPVRFGYRPPRGTDPSDAIQLPDGRLLVLNRGVGLRGFYASLVLVDPAAIRPGIVVTGTPIAQIARPVTIDNLEGVAATVEGGRTILTIISDDNFLPLQRTLLLRFALDP